MVVGCSAGACLFTDLVPAPQQTKLSICPRSQAGSPALPSRVPLLDLRGAHPAHGSGLHAAAREYFPSHHCTLSKPGTCSCMLVYSPPTSSGYPGPLYPAAASSPCCLSHALSLLLFFKIAFVLPLSLSPHAHALSLLILETRGLQLHHRVSPLLLPVLTGMSL